MKKFRFYTSCLIAAFMVMLFIYGFVKFPDGVHTCKELGYKELGYCGKQGQSHTKTEFEEFNFWSTLMFWCWPSGIGALALLQEKKKSPVQMIAEGKGA